MLLGREPELASIDAVLAGARRAAGGALLLEGEPGIGKSALLEHAAEAGAGMEVLRTVGVEAEAELPFAGLSGLLGPLLGRLDELPGAQAGALRAALAIGERPGGPDQVAALDGTSRLVALAAAERPVLVLADDLHWLDRPSAEAIAFLARRTAGLAVALVATRRPVDEPAPAGMGVVEVAPLGPSDALSLLEGAGVTGEIAARVAGVAAGNPLALTEIPGALSAAQRAGAAPLEDPLPAGPTLDRLYGQRIAALPADARTALLVLAASAGGEPWVVGRALAAAGTGPGVLTAAESAGLVRTDAAGVRFGHPLVRSAAYHGATPAERRAAHLWLADAGSEAAPWHRAAAATGPDAGVADALAARAETAVARGAPASAAAALERAAQLTPDPAERFGRALGAAYAALVDGQVAHARSSLDALLPLAEDPIARADVQRLRAGAILLAGHPMEGHELLLAEAERIGDLDPARTAALLVDAGVAQMASGDMRGLAAHADRAAAAAERAGEERPLLPGVMLAEALAVQGEHGRARRIVEGIDLPAGGLITTDSEVLAVGGLCLMWLEEFDRAERWLDRLIGDAREAGVSRALPMPLSVRACVDIRRGNLTRAAARAREAVEIAEVAAAGFGLAFALSTRATVAAWTGDQDTCRTAAARAQEIEVDFEMQGPLAYTELALATLELGLGRTGPATDHSLRCIEAARAYGSHDPSFLQDGANLIEALAREGRGDEAAAALEKFEADAERTRGAWGLAAVARCRGILAGDEDFDQHFDAALAHHDAGPAMPLERARTLLAHGERLRRTRRRAEARAPLASAQRAFDRAGARAWAERAGHELEASAPRRRPAAVPAEPEAGLDLGALTAQEREVCRLVAGGAQNREVAAALFISPRTVEYHLGNAYRKLGVRSRTELAAMSAASA